MKPEMQTIIQKFQSLHPKPIQTLSAELARQQPTITDGFLAVIKDKKLDPALPASDTSGIDIPALHGSIHARLYKPKQGNNWPIVLYYHGGGFVMGSIDGYNASAQALAAESGALVVSVEYRKGPEYKFPMAHRDCFAAYQWALESGDTWGGNPRKVAVAGESAGGNLAASVCLMARQMGMQQPKAAILIYPVAGSNTKTPSYLKYAHAVPLNRDMMLWFFKNYLDSASQAGDERIDLLKANLAGMPPTTIITAEVDPLHDEGEALAGKMQKAGDSVTYKNYLGVTHEFFGMGAIVPEAKEAEVLAGEQLKKAFADKQ